jgi:hypothetical protein
MHIPLSGCAAACAALFVVATLDAAGPPATPKKPVTDAYHGVKVVDDYRWLEDINDPAVRAGSASRK